MRRRIVVLRLAPRHRSRSRCWELHRVVKPDGKLFVQADFSDRIPDVWWLQVVPEWMKIHQAQYRTEDEVQKDISGAGWTLDSRDEVTWLRSASLDEDFKRLKLRPTSLFEHMSDEVVEAGFATIEAALPSLDDGPRFGPVRCLSSDAE